MSHIIYCGVDFHARQQTICCLKTETGELTSHELKHDHKEALRKFYSELGGPVIVGLEASGYTPWFEQLLEELGHQVWLGDATEIRRRARRRQKNDRRDAELILELMLHHEFPRIHRPTPTSREILRMLRYRHKLVKLRTIVKNSLQSLSIQAGLSLQARLFTRQGQQQLLTVPMTPVMRHQGQQWLELLQELNQRITETEGWLKQQALPDPRISLLRTHPGLGLLSSLGIVHTLIPVSRFPNTRKLAAYGGFDPMERSSADKKRYLGISKAGSRLLNGIEELVSHFPSNPLNEESIKSYNRAVEDCIDGVREFLTLHYCTSTRADTPFWKATKSDLVIPEALQERLKLWKVRLPNNRNIIPKYHGFESYSHSVMLIGLGYIPEHSLPVLNHISDEKAMATFQAIKDSAANLCRTLPSQYDCLTSIYNSHKLDGAQAETSRCAQY